MSIRDYPKQPAPDYPKGAVGVIACSFSEAAPESTARHGPIWLKRKLANMHRLFFAGDFDPQRLLPSGFRPDPPLPPITSPEFPPYAIRHPEPIAKFHANIAWHRIKHGLRHKTILVGGDHSQIFGTAIAAAFMHLQKKLKRGDKLSESDKTLFKKYGLITDTLEKPKALVRQFAKLISDLLGINDRENAPARTNNITARTRRSVELQGDELEDYIGPNAKYTPEKDTKEFAKRLKDLALEEFAEFSRGIHYPEALAGLGQIVIDAHGDANTPTTSPSGNVHGMTNSTLMGISSNIDFGLIRPKNVVLIGIRSLESGELTMLQALGVRIFSAGYVKQFGFAKATEEARKYLTAQKVEEAILSIDIDGMDPGEIGTGTGTPVEGGIPAEEALEVFRGAVHDPFYTNVEVSELHPYKDDIDYTTGNFAVNLLKTLAYNAELAAQANGKKAKGA